MTDSRRRAIALAFAPVLLAPVSAAQSVSMDKVSCVDAHASSQTLRRDGKLRSAKREHVRCANEACPSAIRRDCAGWLEETEGALATVVIDAHDAAGRDLGDVEVRIDGDDLPRALEGTPLVVDPGPHVFAFLWAGQLIEQTIVVLAGDRNRRLTVRFSSTGIAAAPSPSATSAERSPPSVNRGGTRGPAFRVAAIAGGVGLAGFVYFGLTANTKKNELAACRPNCSREDLDAVRRDWLLANVGLAVGAAGAAAATVFFLTSSRGPRVRSVGFVPRPGGGILGAGGTF